MYDMNSSEGDGMHCFASADEAMDWIIANAVGEVEVQVWSERYTLSGRPANNPYDAKWAFEKGGWSFI